MTNVWHRRMYPQGSLGEGERPQGEQKKRGSSTMRLLRPEGSRRESGVFVAQAPEMGGQDGHTETFRLVAMFVEAGIIK